MLHKIKNNKGELENVMFVAGCLFIIVILSFGIQLFGVVTQRYIVHRALLNESRLFATRWNEIYIKPDCNGILEECHVNDIEDSKLVKQMEKIINTTKKQGRLDSVEFIIGDRTDSSCNDNDNDSSTYLCISQIADNVSATGRDWDRMKKIDYGTTLYAKISIKYTWKPLVSLGKKQEGYTLVNKFASERFRNSDNIIGS